MGTEGFFDLRDSIGDMVRWNNPHSEGSSECVYLAGWHSMVFHLYPCEYSPTPEHQSQRYQRYKHVLPKIGSLKIDLSSNDSFHLSALCTQGWCRDYWFPRWYSQHFLSIGSWPPNSFIEPKPFGTNFTKFSLKN